MNSENSSLNHKTSFLLPFCIEFITAVWFSVEMSDAGRSPGRSARAGAGGTVRQRRTAAAATGKFRFFFLGSTG